MGPVEVERPEEGQAGGVPSQTPDPREMEGVGSTGYDQPASHSIQAGGEKFDAKGSPPSFSHPLLSISSLDLASFDTLPQTALKLCLLVRPRFASLPLSPSALVSPALSFLQLLSLLFCPSSCLFLQLWQLPCPPSSLCWERGPSEEQRQLSSVLGIEQRDKRKGGEGEVQR